MTSYYKNPFPTFSSYFTDNTFSGLSAVFDELEKSLFTRTECTYPYNAKVLKDGTSVLEYSLAGFTKEDVSLKVEYDKLIVKVTPKKEKKKDDAHYVYRGIAKRSMVHSVKVDPHYHDLKAISAEFENGILTITIPESKESKESNFKVEIK